MTLTYRCRPKLQRGFSLTELIIYIAIVGILALVIVPRALNYYRRAKVSRTEQDIKTIKGEVLAYYGDTGQYPASLEDLVTKPADVPSKKWHGYLDKIPKDGWGNDFEYELTPKGQHPFKLYSWGPEGIDSPETEWIDAWE